MNMLRNLIASIKNFVEALKRDRTLLFVVLVIIGLILLIIFGRVEPPEQEDTQEPTQTFTTKPEETVNTYQDVTPGVTKFDAQVDSLGTYVTEENYKGINVYVYNQEHTARREHIAGVRPDGVMEFIRVPIPYDKAQTLDTYTERLGLDAPDIVMYEKGGQAVQAYVYLDEGVMLSVFEYTREVYNETYFAPTSEESFLGFWGPTLTDEIVLEGHAVPDSERR